MIKQYIAYLKDNPQGYWFKRKLYGWGWTPATWQGWVIVGVYVFILVLLFKSIDKTSHSGSDTLIAFAIPFLIETAVLVIICYIKGEKPKWQWGLPKSNEPTNN